MLPLDKNFNTFPCIKQYWCALGDTVELFVMVSAVGSGRDSVKNWKQSNCQADKRRKKWHINVNVKLTILRGQNKLKLHATTLSLYYMYILKLKENLNQIQESNLLISKIQGLWCMDLPLIWCLYDMYKFNYSVPYYTCVKCSIRNKFIPDQSPETIFSHNSYKAKYKI